MKTLFLDIETAPHKVYAWGLFKQNIALNQIQEAGYTMCWAAKWKGKDDIMFRSIQTHTEWDMAHGIWEMINEADAVVHYNGTKFDMPTLNREFLNLNFPRPAPYKQIDLLRTVRRQFRLASNKLDYVAQYLGLGGKVEHKGMELWRDCMEGKQEAWDIMETYNKHDVRLLEQVYDRVLPWIDGHPNLGLYHGDDIPHCVRCNSTHMTKRGFSYTQTMRYQRYQCSDCGTWNRERINNLPKEKKAAIMVEAK